MSGHVILSHGSGSGPAATKVSVLADVAESMGFTTERPDFADCDALGEIGAVAPRVQRLVGRIQLAAQPPLLVGSSMGAFTAGLASLQAPCAGLFLLALPPYIPGFAQAFDMRRDVPAMLIHGFDDDICPVDAAITRARERGMRTLLVPDGHRLSEHVDLIAQQFRLFLQLLPA